jgi:hypothetical protein
VGTASGQRDPSARGRTNQEPPADDADDAAGTAGTRGDNVIAIVLVACVAVSIVAIFGYILATANGAPEPLSLTLWGVFFFGLPVAFILLIVLLVRAAVRRRRAAGR